MLISISSTFDSIIIIGVNTNNFENDFFNAYCRENKRFIQIYEKTLVCKLFMPLEVLV